jgi:hypothetical protein
METIVEYFQIPIVNKLIRTVLFFILCLSVILLSRRFIQSLKINKSRRQFFKKWATYIIFIIYGLILIHVWAVKDLFHYWFIWLSILFVASSIH